MTLVTVEITPGTALFMEAPSLTECKREPRIGRLLGWKLGQQTSSVCIPNRICVWHWVLLKFSSFSQPSSEEA